MENELTYPIKAVSRLTGLSVHVIRAWERRYNVVTPKRTKTERREYSAEDVERLKLLARAVENGHSIGTIAGLPFESLKEMAGHGGAPVSVKKEKADHEDSGGKNVFFEPSMEAIRQYDAPGLENTLIRALLAMGQENVLMKLIIPLIKTIGDEWEHERLSIAQEHMASSVLVSFFKYMLSLNRPGPGAPLLITATPQGQRHELGALIVALTAASIGWRVLHLGCDLPAREIITAAEDSHAEVVCISLVYPLSETLTVEELKQLGTLSFQGKKVIVGGRASLSYSDVIDSAGMILLNDIHEFRKLLK